MFVSPKPPGLRPFHHVAPLSSFIFSLLCAGVAAIMQYTERPPGYGGADFETAAREEWLAIGAVDQVELNREQQDMIVQFYLQPRNLPNLQQVIDAVSDPR